MSNPTTYQLTVSGGAYTFLINGQEATAVDDFDRAIASIRAARQEFNHAQLSAAVMPIIGKSRIIFPPAPDSVCKYGPVVYFLETSARPGQIKIGRTEGLRVRLQQIKRDFEREGVGRVESLAVLAYIETPEFKRLDLGLHSAFDAIRIPKSDWFDAEALRPFIDSLRHLPNTSLEADQ